MPAILKPIRRVWKPSVSASEPMISKFNNFEIELPLPNVLEKNTDSIWDTYEALQAAESEKVTKLTQ
jgi:hypothetical protein